MDADFHVIEEVARQTEIRAALTVSHYLYFPDTGLAGAAAEALKSTGYKVEERPAALPRPNEKILVLASHETVLSLNQVKKIRADMEALADRFEGTYDGWEVELPRPEAAPTPNAAGQR